MNLRSNPIGLFFMLVIPLVVLACTDSVTSQQASPPPKEYAVLLRVDTFYGAHIGFGGITPPEVYAYRDLLDHPGADRYFKELIEEATLPGQLYGLAGVYFTDPPAVAELAERFLRSDETVPAFFGCILEDWEVKRLASRIVDGSIPRELLDEWAP